MINFKTAIPNFAYSYIHLSFMYPKKKMIILIKIKIIIIHKYLQIKQFFYSHII